MEEGWTFNRGDDNYGWSLSPDGTRIALRRYADGITGQTVLFELPDEFLVGAAVNSYSVSPDDQRFLMARAYGAPEDVNRFIWSRTGSRN